MIHRDPGAELRVGADTAATDAAVVAAATRPPVPSSAGKAAPGDGEAVGPLYAGPRADAAGAAEGGTEYKTSHKPREVTRQIRSLCAIFAFVK